MHITPFLSWDLIHVGACHWDDQRQATPCDVPKGVEIRVEPASKTDPILAADQAWECGRLGWTQVMEDDGRYRMWYSITPAEPTKDRLLCYAESEDGSQWKKPELGLIEVEGSKANNVVFAGNGANHSCVLKCTDGPAETRYRCMLMANYRTEPGGWIRFELADRLMWPPQPWPGIDGYRFEDMPAMQGDETHALVSWNRSPDLSALKGRPVAIRVRLHKATLFATTMYGIDDPLVQDDPRYPV